jgi:hypothetical protein
MISRGIDGVIIDWYGSNTFEDQATQVVMAEAESQPGFTFAIMVDQGAIKWDSCAGCSPQQALINQLQYVEQKYFSSPAYMTDLGRPVVTNFNIDLAYSIDWNAVNAALSTHPLFLFQNNSGFSHVLSELACPSIGHLERLRGRNRDRVGHRQLFFPVGCSLRKFFELDSPGG